MGVRLSLRAPISERGETVNAVALEATGLSLQVQLLSLAPDHHPHYISGMKLFLDDIRDPPDNTWSVARTYFEAVDLVRELGFPEEISFDHDLGGEKTGLDLAHYLIDLDLDRKSMPSNFSFSVHSANPVGRANIVALLDGYMRFRNGSS